MTACHRGFKTPLRLVRRVDNEVAEVGKAFFTLITSLEFRTLHKSEEELYFYDTFAYLWEKEKQYRMVYQLEKKYFPDQRFDKAFLEPGESNAKADKVKNIVGKSGERKEKAADGRDEKGLVFFEHEEVGKNEIYKGSAKDVKIAVSEKKVEEFFKCLKKVPNKDAEVANAEPFLSTRSTGLQNPFAVGTARRQWGG